MMEKLPMCRICSAENVHMYVVVNKTLHDLYEKMTDIPFVTEDIRPILACFICCAQLKKCYRFQKKCLDAEEQFAKMIMIKEEYEIKPLINQDQFEFFHGFIRTPIDTISIVDVDQTENIVVKEELPAVCERLDDIIEKNEEHESDDDIKTVNIYDNYLDIEAVPLHHSESDSDDDVPLLEVKKEGEAEKTSGPPAVKKQETDTRRTKLADLITTKQKEADPKMIQDNQNRTSESYIAKHQKVQNRINDSRRKFGLSQHRDTGEKRYKCDYCPNTFRYDSLLARHRLIHIGEKPFKCDICQRCFRLKAGLNQHKRLHTGEKPFKCDICPDTFRYSSGLTLHKQKHASHKPYQCDVCQERFHRPCYLRSHYQIHTGEKSFQCDMCQSSFSRKTSLERHIFSHTGEKPFQCHICQKCFNRKSTLTIHINRHTGEKPFKCHICQSTFTQKSTLTTHIKNHTGKKPFQCHICQSCFSRRSTLTKHMNRHTGEKDLEKQDGI